MKNHEHEQTLFTENDFDFILNASETSPGSGIREVVIDFSIATTAQKDFISQSLRSANEGKPFNKPLFNNNLEPEERFTNQKHITSYVIPEEIIQFSGNTNPLYAIDEQDPYLVALFPTKENVSFKTTLVAEHFNTWKITSKTTRNTSFIILTPQTSDEQKTVVNICDNAGLETYLDGYEWYLNNIPLGEQQQYINIDKTISYLLSVYRDIAPQNNTWSIDRLGNKTNSYRTWKDNDQVISEIFNNDFDMLFHEKVREFDAIAKHISMYIDNIKSRYDIVDDLRIPINTSISSYRSHDIFSYYFGLSPKISKSNIQLYVECAKQLSQIVPDFEQYLPDTIRILSVPRDYRNNTMGFTKLLQVSDMLFSSADNKYNFLFLQQSTFQRSENTETMRHEMIHQYFYNKKQFLGGNIYIIEGLAEYYGTYLGEIQPSVKRKISKEAIKDLNSLLELQPTNSLLQYTAGPLFIDYVISTYGEKMLFEWIEIDSLYNEKILLTTKEKILNSPLNRLYYTLFNDFAEYLQKLAM